MPKRPTQREIILEFFESNPHQDIAHPRVVDWATSEFLKRTGKPFRDPDRQIRQLAQQGFLIKVGKGIYRYDPDRQERRKQSLFTAALRAEILKRDGYRCVFCGRGRPEGVELHVDHIRPVDSGGEATISNGQTTCGQHNYLKRNFSQSESMKRSFIRMYEKAKEDGEEWLVQFCRDVLAVYDEHDINGHIEWTVD